MKVHSKKLGENQLLLECEATPQEVNEALQAAQVGFAQSMGLQPEQGKTVAQVAEERMGIKNLDSIVEASAIAAMVPHALDKKNLVPAFPPEAQPKSALKRDQSFTFDLPVALKPDYELTSYEPVEITVPPFSFDETLVDRQLEAMAERYATFVTADPKPIEAGDSALIAMKCTEDGKEIPGLTTDGRTFTAGQGYMPEGFEEQVLGMEPGQTKTFTFEGPDFDEDFNPRTQTVECTLTVIEIQKPEDPKVDDAWVQQYMPMYKGVEDLRADIARGLEHQAREEYENYKRQLVANALAPRFQGMIADEVYETMRSNLLNNIHAEVQQQGMTWEQFVEQNGGDQQLGMMLMLQTREMLVQGYCLDAIYRHEGLTLTDEDIEAACRAMNPQGNPKQTRQQLETTGRGFALREAAERLKANNWVLEHAKITVLDPEQAAPVVEEQVEEVVEEPAE